MSWLEQQGLDFKKQRCTGSKVIWAHFTFILNDLRYIFSSTVKKPNKNNKIKHQITARSGHTTMHQQHANATNEYRIMIQQLFKNSPMPCEIEWLCNNASFCLPWRHACKRANTKKGKNKWWNDKYNFSMVLPMLVSAWYLHGFKKQGNQFLYSQTIKGTIIDKGTIIHIHMFSLKSNEKCPGILYSWPTNADCWPLFQTLYMWVVISIHDTQSAQISQNALYAPCLACWAFFGSLIPAMCNRISCAQVHELPQSYCGDNQEGTLFSWLLYMIYTYLINLVYLENDLLIGTGINSFHFQ